MSFLFWAGGRTPAKSKDTRLEMMQKDYVFHLYALFKPLGIVLAEPMVRLSKNQSTKNIHTAYRFTTVTLPYFTELHSFWYKQIDGKNVKIVPKNIEEFLTPTALAHWRGP